MTLNPQLTLFIYLALSTVGALFIVSPKTARRLEQWLNQPLSRREVLAIRLGLPGEQRLEQPLNRNVQGTCITWDRWIHEHPRIAGLLLCAIAALLWLI